MLRSKQGKTMAWLPTQVAYGIDCSDDDPEKWTPFGEHAETTIAETTKHSAPKPVEK